MTIKSAVISARASVKADIEQSGVTIPAGEYEAYSLPARTDMNALGGKISRSWHIEGKPFGRVEVTDLVASGKIVILGD